MKLYDLAAGLNPRRVRIFLAEKGVSIPIVPVDMLKGENATPAFLAINPLGKLPVLELDDGSHISESTAICRYIESVHPEPNLFGRDARESAAIEMWDRRIELTVMAPILHAFRHLSPFWAGRVIQVAEWGDVSKKESFERLKWLDDELATRQFIAGDRYTVADITLQCTMIVAKNVGIRIPEDHSNLSRWFQQVSARPTARA